MDSRRLSVIATTSMELEEGIARSAQPAAQGAERHGAGPASKFVIGALSVHPAQRRPCGEWPPL